MLMSSSNKFINLFCHSLGSLKMQSLHRYGFAIWVCTVFVPLLELILLLFG